jgi:hypothetical protein
MKPAAPPLAEIEDFEQITRNPELSQEQQSTGA